MEWERESNPFPNFNALPDIKITLDHKPLPHITKLIVLPTRSHVSKRKSKKCANYAAKII
jgi:hypothetical protein